MGRSVVGAVGAYLPQAVTGMLEPERHFAYIKIPKVSSTPAASNGSTGLSPSATVFTPSGPRPLRSVVAMSSNSPQVMVVTSEGGFFVFNIDMENGGEGYLVRQFS